MKSDHSQEALVPRLLVGLVTTVCRYPLLVLTTALALAGGSLYLAHTRLEYRTQRTDLVNPNKDYQQRWRQYLAEFGDEDDIVVVVQGRDRPQMQQAIDALADEVRNQPELFDRLFYKVDLRPLHDRALQLLPTEQIENIQASLKRMSLLLDFGPLSWRSLTLLSLLQEARGRLGELAPGQTLTPADEQFLGQLRAICQAAAATLGDPKGYRNPWSSLVAPSAGPRSSGQSGEKDGSSLASGKTDRRREQQDLLAAPQYFFSEDGQLAFMLVRPVKDTTSFTPAASSVEAMRAIVAAVRPGYPDLDFGLTGLPVLETDEMSAAQRDTHLASWLAVLGVTLLFFLVYRSIYYPLLTVATLLIGTAWAIGWLTLTVGHLNILSATFAVMLIGMGDYGVLWVMRYEHARQLGADVLPALQHTTTHVAVGNLTAATTLALAFYAAMLADFQAVAELGWIAGCGVLLCALACFTVLPALLMLFDRRKRLREWEMEDQDGRRMILSFGSHPVTLAREQARGWLPSLTVRPWRIIVTGVLLTVALGCCAVRVRYDHNLLNLQARGLDSVKWEMTLIEHMAGASWHALSWTDTPEQARELKARFEQLPEVSRVVEVASLVPADQERKLDLLRDIQKRLTRLPERGERIPHARPNSLHIEMELTALLLRLKPLAESGPPLLAELRSDLLALQTRLNEASGGEQIEPRLQEFEERLTRDLADDLHQLRSVSTPEPIAVTDLPASLRERYLGASGKWLLQVYGKGCLWDFEPLEHFCQQVQSIDPEATGKPFATVEGLRAMKNGFQWAGLYAFLAITLVLAIDFRSLKYTLIALAPLLMGLVLSLGILGLCGLPLNPANMIALPLILGVGVDNGVHVLHDWLLRRREGKYTISRPIGRGVLVKALTTMIGFGTLMISSQRGLIGLGFILTLGVACCMLTALVFLPAVLRLLGQTAWPERIVLPAEGQQRAA